MCFILKGELEAVHGSLLLDGESVYSLVSNPLLLLLARVILAQCSDHMSDLQVRQRLHTWAVHTGTKVLFNQSTGVVQLAGPRQFPPVGGSVAK